jgi:hypothetical protein
MAQRPVSLLPYAHLRPAIPLVEALVGGLFLAAFGYFGLTWATVGAWIFSELAGVPHVY